MNRLGPAHPVVLSRCSSSPNDSRRFNTSGGSFAADLLLARQWRQGSRSRIARPHRSDHRPAPISRVAAPCRRSRLPLHRLLRPDRVRRRLRRLSGSYQPASRRSRSSRRQPKSHRDGRGVGSCSLRGEPRALSSLHASTRGRGSQNPSFVFNISGNLTSRFWTTSDYFSFLDHGRFSEPFLEASVPAAGFHRPMARYVRRVTAL